MVEKVQFETEEEKQQIIFNKSAMFLIEEQRLFEGNFLIFSDVSPEKEVVYVNLPAEELEAIKIMAAQQETVIEELMFIIIPELTGGGI
ncbi:hypothetical protein BTO30_12495 [Domibacillus antri]|uniref:Uncharacterized protein n=1 Tax=Domibacillus antri TaxID=1714264 RepID=A0A1Q8Q3R8_9BACI|nr:hypothetical protein [Domibacillus antri]OLN21911.1 hypothetical protein BTO30_12495 [Domibacillus antri]